MLLTGSIKMSRNGPQYPLLVEPNRKSEAASHGSRPHLVSNYDVNLG
jgi:hypothetical protein